MYEAIFALFNATLTSSFGFARARGLMRFGLLMVYCTLRSNKFINIFIVSICTLFELVLNKAGNELEPVRISAVSGINTQNFVGKFLVQFYQKLCL